jgi:hypothetical protein
VRTVLREQPPPDPGSAGLPPELPASLWPLLPALADEVIAAIGDEVPVYARPLEGNFGAGVRRGVQDALRGFVELLESGASRHDAVVGAGAAAIGDETAGHRRVSFELGRGEFRQGRSLDALLAAYRVGARVTWHRCGAAASALGLSGAALVRLGELLFTVIDALSAAAAEGYAREQSERAGEIDRRRRRLGELLVSGTATEAVLQEVAAAAAWRPPGRLSAVVADRPDSLQPLLADPDTLPAPLPASDEMRSVVLVPDADGPGRRPQLRQALLGAVGPVAVGPAVPWTEARRSLRRAVSALRLFENRDDGAPGLLWTSDLLVPLVLHADPELGADLVGQALAPLDDLPSATRDRLAETLAAWLAHQGARGVVAAELHVHPQTVRYRLAQLRDLFGTDLDEPERRFALMLALRLRGPRTAADPGA